MDARATADPARRTAHAQARRLAAQLDAAGPQDDDDEMRARLDQIRAVAEDPAVQFERLTGRPLPPRPSADGGTA